MNNKITIFLPVHTGGEFFRRCVESILVQTHTDFTLIVLENKSEDENIKWINSLNDPRIKVFESTMFLSIENNWARIMNIPKEKYMTMIGHDDLFDPDYLEIMCNLINAYPNASLYHAHFRFIDKYGNKIRSCLPMPTVEKADAFLESRLTFKRDSFGTGYLFRSSDYEKAGGIPCYNKLMFADDTLWLSLLKDSYKATDKKECYSYRWHSRNTSYSPGWKATFESFQDFLGFLDCYSQNNRAISNIIQKRLLKYSIACFQRAYFSIKGSSEEKNAAQAEIIKIIEYIRDILQESGHYIPSFESDVRKYVFGFFSYHRWIFWHFRMWFKRRFPRLFY